MKLKGERVFLCYIYNIDSFNFRMSMKKYRYLSFTFLFKQTLTVTVTFVHCIITFLHYPPASSQTGHSGFLIMIRADELQTETSQCHSCRVHTADFCWPLAIPQTVPVT